MLHAVRDTTARCGSCSESAHIQVLQQVNLKLLEQSAAMSEREQLMPKPTIITLSSLLGRSASLTFFTATVSPVPQFRAL